MRRTDGSNPLSPIKIGDGCIKNHLRGRNSFGLYFGECKRSFSSRLQIKDFPTGIPQILLMKILMSLSQLHSLRTQKFDVVVWSVTMCRDTVIED